MTDYQWISAPRTVEYEGRGITYTIRVSRMRKTAAVQVYRDGRVYVTMPRKTSMHAADAQVMRLAARILRQLDKFRIADAAHNAGGDVEPEPSVMHLGRRYRVKTGRAIKAGVRLADDVLHVDCHRPSDEGEVRSRIADWQRQSAQGYFEECLRHALSLFPDPSRVAPSQLVIRDIKSSWGSMHRNGKMTLALRLIAADPECILYVIVHELCHRVHFDHSKAFWVLVESVLPQWKVFRKRLKDYRMSPRSC